MKKHFVSVSEKVIEDILVADKHIIAEVLSLEYSDLSMFARQKYLNSGILDLLYVWKDELLLIELKVVPFYNGVIEQINGYYNDLLYLQSVNRLINTTIRKYILVPCATKKQIEFCKAMGIILVVFDVKLILERYYQNFKKLTSFMKIKSGDYGVVRLGLLNSTLQHFSKGNSIKKISVIENRDNKTIKNRLSVTTLLGLTGKSNKEYFLTELGTNFINLAVNINDQLSESQKGLLREFVNSNPFYSTITYTISSLVECIFTLSKSNYPVSREALTDYFVKSVGKTTEWNTVRAKETATYIFSNYAVELDLLSKVDNEFYLTPSGIKSVLLMQLQRSIKLIEKQ